MAFIDLIYIDDPNDIPLKYIKGELIGFGSYGKVYQGLDRSTG